MLEGISTAVFDCDGVLLDSNRVKTDAFRDAVAEEASDLVEQFITYHQTHGGVSRYEKFRHFFTEIAPAEDPDAAVAAALSRYADVVRRALGVCPTIPGVIDCLDALAARGVPMYVVSGGDQTELCEVFAARGLDGYFRRICGSPTPKRDHMEALAAADCLVPPVIYFGDARLDLELAEAFGARFVFVSGVSEWADGPVVAAERGHTVMPDFTGMAFDA